VLDSAKPDCRVDGTISRRRSKQARVVDSRGCLLDLQGAMIAVAATQHADGS